MKQYRLIHDNIKVVNIIEASGITCSNGNEIVDGNLEEIYNLIDQLNLTNHIPLSCFGDISHF